MTDRPSRRWFQLSLRSLFLLTLLVATFLAGYTLAERQAEASRRASDDLRIKAETELEQARALLSAMSRRVQLDGW